MASLLYAYPKALSLLSRELLGAGLLGVEVIKARSSAQDFSVLGYLQSFCI
jgi:hypothetical protein